MKNKRNLGEEILEGLREIKSGGGKRYTVFSAEHIHDIREKMSLSQTAFAGLLGVSVRTLQGWEQGRRKPRGAAVALLRVASRHPETLIR